MRPLKILSRLTQSLIAFIMLLAITGVALELMKITIVLDGNRPVLIDQIRSLTGRDVRIDGEVRLTVSFSPRLLVQQLHLSDINGFANDHQDFLSISEVSIEVPLLPLLSGQLHLRDISADQAKVNLVQRADGNHSWIFNSTGMSQKPADKTTTATEKSSDLQLSIGTLQLTDVALTYSDASRDQVIKEQIDKLVIDLRDSENIIAEISGDIQSRPYNMTFESDTLDTVPSEQPWKIHGTGLIANRQTRIEASLRLEDKMVSSNIEISVDDVDIGQLLEVLEIIPGQEAATDNVNLKVKLQGSDLTELYQQAEISLQFGAGVWNLPASETDGRKTLAFTGANAFASWKKPVEMQLNGILEGETLNIDFRTNRLSEFFDDVQQLDVNLKAKIADTDISLAGRLDLPIRTRQFNLDITLSGKDLERLNPIINSEFPPFNDFDLSGKLIANERGYVLQSAKAAIGDSELQGSIVIETVAKQALWTINMKSTQLQLDDFKFDGLDFTQSGTTPEPAVSAAPAISAKQKYALEPLMRLEKVVQSPKMHLDLNVTADRILSGKDVIGKTRFQLHLRNNSISLKNAEIELPGGRISAAIAVRKEKNKATGNIKLDIDKLDYGITTRFFKADSTVDGTISTRIDLELGGENFAHLLDNASGLFDIVVWPKNTKPAKILNLWATNLYLILLPELKKKESRVYCMVGLMNLDNGSLKEEFLAIDTSKLWIYGNLEVDFKQEQVKLSLFPRSKTARLFALQSPIRAQGSFTDIGMDVNPVDITTTYISFITSPLHVPTRWVFGDKIPEDGSAVCEQFFDREYVVNLNKKLKQKEQEEIDEMLESD